VRGSRWQSLLGDIDISQSKGALIRVVGGEDLTIAEAQQAAELVTSRISPSARIIWGCTVDPTIHGDVNLLVVITGVRSPQLMGADERAGTGAGIAMVR